MIIGSIPDLLLRLESHRERLAELQCVDVEWTPELEEAAAAELDIRSVIAECLGASTSLGLGDREYSIGPDGGAVLVSASVLMVGWSKRDLVRLAREADASILTSRAVDSRIVEQESASDLQVELKSSQRGKPGPLFIPNGVALLRDIASSEAAADQRGWLFWRVRKLARSATRVVVGLQTELSAELRDLLRELVEVRAPVMRAPSPPVSSLQYFKSGRRRLVEVALDVARSRGAVLLVESRNHATSLAHCLQENGVETTLISSGTYDDDLDYAWRAEPHRPGPGQAVVGTSALLSADPLLGDAGGVVLVDMQCIRTEHDELRLRRLSDGGEVWTFGTAPQLFEERPDPTELHRNAREAADRVGAGNRQPEADEAIDWCDRINVAWPAFSGGGTCAPTMSEGWCEKTDAAVLGSDSEFAEVVFHLAARVHLYRQVEAKDIATETARKLSKTRTDQRQRDQVARSCSRGFLRSGPVDYAAGLADALHGAQDQDGPTTAFGKLTSRAVKRQRGAIREQMVWLAEYQLWALHPNVSEARVAAWDNHLSSQAGFGDARRKAQRDWEPTACFKSVMAALGAPYRQPGSDKTEPLGSLLADHGAVQYSRESVRDWWVALETSRPGTLECLKRHRFGRWTVESQANKYFRTFLSCVCGIDRKHSVVRHAGRGTRVFEVPDGVLEWIQGMVEREARCFRDNKHWDPLEEQPSDKKESLGSSSRPNRLGLPAYAEVLAELGIRSRTRATAEPSPSGPPPPARPSGAGGGPAPGSAGSAHGLQEGGAEPAAEGGAGGEAPHLGLFPRLEPRPTTPVSVPVGAEPCQAGTELTATTGLPTWEGSKHQVVAFNRASSPFLKEQLAEPPALHPLHVAGDQLAELMHRYAGSVLHTGDREARFLRLESHLGAAARTGLLQTGRHERDYRGRIRTLPEDAIGNGCLQEVPGVLRPAFSAGAERVLLDVDFDRCSLAVLAQIAGDQELLQKIQAGDLHQDVGADLAPHLPVNEQRRLGKRVNVAIPHGIGHLRLAAELAAAGLDGLDAKVLRHRWWARFSGLDRFRKLLGRHQQCSRKTGKSLGILDPLGRPRVLSGQNVYRGPTALSAMWTVVEVCALDIAMHLALERADQVDLDLRLHLPMYDGALWSAPSGQSHLAAQILGVAFTEASAMVGFPLAATVKVGSNWSFAE